MCGDIHGRTFWKEPCKNVDKYEKIIFLGDYVDPYDFEKISVESAIDNFKEIIEFKKNNMDKVILLLGNHCMPYFSKLYYGFSLWHCRHSTMHHTEIHNLYNDNKDLFQIAYVYKDILFTHAGVENGWLKEVVECDKTDINDICDTLNELLNTDEGIMKLYCITSQRGGRSRYGSCIWSDVDDIYWDIEDTNNPMRNIKQVFGHTLQAFYDENRKIVFGKAIEFENCKMIDTTKPYELDCETFEVNAL